jgi:hypothetical protein
LGKFNQNSLAELVEITQEKQNFPKKFKLLYRKMAKFRQKKINGKHSFFWQFLFNSWSGNDPHEDLARLRLHAQYESNFKKPFFYILGYLLEPCVVIIWRDFFLKFLFLATEFCKKHDFRTFNL